MTFFSKFFGHADKIQVPIRETQIERSLFVDDSDPLEQSQPSLPQTVSALEILLNRNFEMLGYVDGYDTHSLDMMELKIQSITAQFQQALRGEIEKTDKACEELNPFINEKIKEKMPDHYLKLSSRFDGLNLKRAELSAMLDLSGAREGICKDSVLSYEMGYTTGFKAWSDEIHFKL